MFLDASSWVSSGRLLLEGPKHGVEVVADRGHVQVVGAKGRLPDLKRPLILFSCTFQTRQAVGMDAPEPTARHHSDTARTAVQGGHLAWPAGRRERTPRRTATAADRLAGRAFLWSCAVVHPCGLAGDYK